MSVNEHLPALLSYLRREWKLLAVRVPLYAAGMYLIYTVASGMNSPAAQTAVGSVLACALVAAELALTAKLKGVPVRQAATARLLLIDLIAAGRDDAVVTRIRERDMLTADTDSVAPQLTSGRPAANAGAGAGAGGDLLEPFEGSDPFPAER